jgi:hypothetical protein
LRSRSADLTIKTIDCQHWQPILSSAEPADPLGEHEIKAAKEVRYVRQKVRCYIIINKLGIISWRRPVGYPQIIHSYINSLC